MKLIADSGSTKTDWTLIHDADWHSESIVVASFSTQGITPIHQSPAEIRQIIGQELMPHLSTFPRAQLINSRVLEAPLLSNMRIYFYGSGCTPSQVPVMKQILGEFFSPQNVEVHSDLMAAARALCQKDAGIACILGTGANSCLYDGEEIVQNTPPLGYVLGDEGSGAVLGKLFMNAIFKDAQFAAIQEEYLKETGLSMPDIINKVYREPLANRFLASVATFVHQHLDFEPLRQMVVDNFRTFFQRNVQQYQHHDLPIHAIGSIAFYFQNELAEAAKLENFTLGTVLRTPMEGLISYHQEAR
mgnify:CR=1 FL=1